ncbi:MAG: hypothetical protein ACR2OH_13875 [Microthrixaceae bacterium]
MRDTLLVLHIIGVAAWLGANFTLAFTGSMTSEADPSTRRWWAGAQGNLARIYKSVAATLVLITGVWLVLDNEGLSMGSTFVSIGFAAIIIGILFGIFVYGPGCRQIAAAIDQGDDASEKSVNNRLAAFGAVESLILVVTIVAMVGGWGLRAPS